MNFDETMNRFTKLNRVAGLATRTQEKYAAEIKKMIDYFDLDDISDLDLRMAQDYLIYIDTEFDYAPRTFNVIVYALRKFFKVVLQFHNADDALPKKKTETVQKEFMTVEQAKIYFEQCEDLRLKAAIALALACGLRSNEVVNLTAGDINKAQHKITIRQSKGNKTRTVPYSDSVAHILNDYCSSAGLVNLRSDQFIFPNIKKPGAHLVSTTITSAFKDYLQEFEFTLSDYSFHQLRHCFATELANQNVPLTAIQKLMGHSSAATTSLYIHNSRQEIESIPDVLLHKENEHD